MRNIYISMQCMLLHLGFMTDFSNQIMIDLCRPLQHLPLYLQPIKMHLLLTATNGIAGNDVDFFCHFPKIAQLMKVFLTMHWKNGNKSEIVMFAKWIFVYRKFLRKGKSWVPQDFFTFGKFNKSSFYISENTASANKTASADADADASYMKLYSQRKMFIFNPGTITSDHL